MLFKKLIVPMCQNYYTRDCSRLIICKRDIKDMFFDKTNLKIILNNKKPKEISWGIFLSISVWGVYLITNSFTVFVFASYTFGFPAYLNA